MPLREATSVLCPRVLPCLLPGRRIIRGQSPEDQVVVLEVCHQVASPCSPSIYLCSRAVFPVCLPSPDHVACRSRANHTGSCHRTTDFNGDHEGGGNIRSRSTVALPMSFFPAKPARYLRITPPPQQSFSVRAEFWWLHRPTVRKGLPGAQCDYGWYS